MKKVLFLLASYILTASISTSLAVYLVKKTPSTTVTTTVEEGVNRENTAEKKEVLSTKSGTKNISRFVQDEVQTVSFTIAAAKKTDTVIYLNSNKDYRQPDTQTVVIDLEKCPNYSKINTRLLNGVTVTATGRMDSKGRILIVSEENVALH